MTAAVRLKKLGIKLSSPQTPVGNFSNFATTGNLVFISGQGPVDAHGQLQKGKVGSNVDIETAYYHARLVAINLLSVLQFSIGNLDRVKRVVKIVGFVNAVPEFERHPEVINGCSDLLVEVLGERGVHARSSIGVGSLPNNITVEIEAIIEVYDGEDIHD